MEVLGEADGPVGARLAARSLADRGIDISEASVSRLFLQLDGLGLTGVTSKGRTLTPHGRRRAAEQALADHRNRSFERVLDVRTAEEIVDWLRARMAVERAATHAAALHAAPEQIAELERLLTEHEAQLSRGEDPTPSAMRFHEEVARASHSPILLTLVTSLHAPNLLRIERALDVITGRHGTIGDSPGEHVRILQAIKTHDPEAAEQAMMHHLERLIVEVESFSKTALGGILPQLLDLVHVPHI